MAVMLTIFIILLSWTAVSLVLAFIWHCLLAPRRHERDRLPPLPWGSLQRDDDQVRQ